MPSAMRGMMDEMKTGGFKPDRSQMGMGGPRRPRDFVAPPASMPEPGAAPPGRPRSATRALMEEAMARGGVAGPRMGGIKPARFQTATEPMTQAPAQAQYQPTPPRVPMGTGGPNPQWFPQLDPVKVRRAQFGQWFNTPGAPPPDLGHSGPMYNPMLGRWVR